MKQRDMKQMHEIFRHLSLLTQLGLSLVTPVLICMAVCWLLTDKAGVGAWVYIPGFIFGLGGSFMSAWKFGKMISSAQTKEDQERKIRKRRGSSFNGHI